MDANDHDAITRRSFEQQVRLFAANDSPFARRSDSPQAWLEPLSPDMVVLDVACGAAHVAEQVAPFVRQVIGVDLTRALLDVGAARLRASGIGNVLLQEGNAATLPFVDGSFDLVVSRTGLHHFADPAAAVAEMARVCRPGGRVAVADMVAPGPDERGAFDELHRAMDPSHVRALLDVELAELIGTTVGPLTYGDELASFTLPIDAILTEAADRDAVTAPLRAELEGGPPTGFHPARDGNQVLVSFRIVVVHATRRPAPDATERGSR